MSELHDKLLSSNLKQWKELLKKATKKDLEKMVYGITILHKAINLGVGSLYVEQLLKAGANPNQEDGMGDSPLYNAFSEDREDIVKVLLDYGVKIDAKTMQKYGKYDTIQKHLFRKKLGLFGKFFK